MQQKTVLLLGSYGQTNVGDDLLMWNYLHYLRKQGFGCIYVNANSRKNIPAPIKRAFPQVKVVLTYKTSLIQWVRLLRRVNCVVYGGGTVYKELYGSTGRSKYSVISRIMLFNVLARLMGARIYHLHIGIGQLKSRLGRAITALALRTSDFTIFRDKESYSFARETLALPTKGIARATDGLFIGTRWLTPWHSAQLVPRGKHTRVVGINVLSDIPDWIDRRQYLMSIRQFISQLLEQRARVVLLPFQHDFNPNNDRVFMEREILPHFKGKEVVLVDQVPIDKVVSYLKQVDVFVGMRFHSLLLATVTGTPYVGIAYDTKCWRFLQEAQYPHAVRIEALSVAHLQKAYNNLLQNLPRAAGTLKAIAKRYQQEGQQCLDRLDF